MITPDYIAAIDLGSNSFHMMLARRDHGELRPIERLKTKVQLGAALDDQNRLSGAPVEAALATLARFGQRVGFLPRECVRVVGTDTLRRATNAREFLDAASAVLSHEVEVIEGVEEARLIYLGAAHSLGGDSQARLVIDIGGGSTEFAAGRGFTPTSLHSLDLGSVSTMRRFFSQQSDLASAMADAGNAALRVLSTMPAQSLGQWHQTIGTSGTVESVERVLLANAWGRDGISSEGLDRIIEWLHTEASTPVKLAGLHPEREDIFPAGVAILRAIFDHLDIRRMVYADGALKEGLLYEMSGRDQHEDVRERTIDALMARHDVDSAQALRVQHTALGYLDQVAASLPFDASPMRDLLRWSARLHELGLSISHVQRERHGAYIISHTELPGFSASERDALSILIRGHRRAFPQVAFAALGDDQVPMYRVACILLRLAVLVNRERREVPTAPMSISIDMPRVELTFDEGWLQQRPLTGQDLDYEQDFLHAAGFILTVSQR